MRNRTGTGYVIALLLAFTLVCSGALFAQLTTSIDKLTPGVKTPAANATADINSVDCYQWNVDKTACVTGQYFHGDGTIYDPIWHDNALVTLDTATPRPGSLNEFGNWMGGNYNPGGVAGPTNFLKANNGCLTCHHKIAAGNGSPYLIGGHKNLFRKVVPGQKLFTSEGILADGLMPDHNGGTHTVDYLTGSLDGTFKAYYLTSYGPAPQVFGTSSATGAYGSCGRCHMTGYREDATGPEPTSLDPTTNTYTKLTDAQFSRIPPGGNATNATGTTSSWYLTSIQCERCHRVDMQVDPSLTPASAAGRIGHHNIGGVASGANGIVPNDGINHTSTGTPYRIPGTDLTLTGAAGATVSAGITVPYALLCVECHQAAATWTSKDASTYSEIHPTPLPGFESLVPTMDTTKFTTTKPASGQFSATWGCTGATGPVIAKNDYDGCVNAGGTVTYVPGGMSHGAVATILNSPHARVAGYVDYKSQGTGDWSLQVIGGMNGGAISTSHFASEGGVAGSCMGCHNVHGYMDGYFETSAVNVEKTLKDCTECHANHGKAMSHPTGPGTPYPDGNFGSQESCNICHFSKKTGTEYHFLRINPDVNYSTFPDARTYYTTTGSGLFGKLNTYNSGETYKDASGATQPYPAVALDVDIACGQCHTGGNGSKNPYGLTAYAGDNGVAPRAYSRAWLAAKAVAMHSTAPELPTLSVPLPAFGGPTTITISSNDSSEGSAIGLFYTLDGSTPSVKVGPDYVSYVPATTATIACAGNPCSVAISTTKTLYAIAAGPHTYNFGVSGVVGGTYGVQVAPTPVIAPTGAAINYPATLSVKLSDSITAAQICYTTDGSAPVAGTNCIANGQSITVNKSMVVKAMATVAGYGNSSVASATFTVKPPTPSWSNVAPAKFPGTYVGAVTAALTDADANAQICYTTDGTTPTAASTCVASGAPITVSASATIKAIAVDGTAVSGMTSGTFVIK